MALIPPVPMRTDGNPTESRLCLLTLRILADADGIRHAFTTRPGGVSIGIHASLNLGLSRGDRRENVTENYRILADAVGFDVNNAAYAKQVHSDTVRVVREGAAVTDPAPFPCDALITDQEGIALVVYSADCVPILLYNPVRRCIGAVHAGWRGTANGILRKAVRMMETEYQSDPSDLLAAIGPAIGQCCFEVDRAVYDSLHETYPEMDRFTIQKGEKYYPDLKALNQSMLTRCGVLPANISVSESCTKCDSALFWSHRRDGDKRGVQGAVIVMYSGNR